jgi:hypothetical protein
MQLTRSDKPITTVVPLPADNSNALCLRKRLTRQFGAGRPSGFHQID